MLALMNVVLGVRRTYLVVSKLASNCWSFCHVKHCFSKSHRDRRMCMYNIAMCKVSEWL